MKRLLAVLALCVVVPAADAAATSVGSTTLISAPPGVLGPFAGLINDGGLGSLFLGQEIRTVSDDGTKVVFYSSSDAIDPSPDDDTYGGIYVRDVTSHTTTLVSRATGVSGAVANGVPGSPTISADGTRVAYVVAATNLDPADTDDQRSVYVRDLTSNTTILASRATGAAGATANNDAWQPSLSANGRYVAFMTGATNLSSPVSSTSSIYRRDTAGNTTSLVSTRTDGTRVSGYAPSISPDGLRVAFTSYDAIDSVKDTNANSDVYLATVGSPGAVVLVSRVNGAASNAGNNGASNPSLAVSAGIYKIAFLSFATDLTATTDTNTARDAFVRDMTANTTTLVSRATGAGGALANQGTNDVSIARDASAVVFASSATNLGGATNGTQEVYARTGATTSLVSRATGASGDPADRYVSSPSSDGSASNISFVTLAGNLSSANDDDFSAMYVRHVGATSTEFVSRPTGLTDFVGGVNGAQGASSGQTVSDSGRFVTFSSDSDALSGEDDNRYTQVFRYDAVTGAVVLISRATGAAGVAANGFSYPYAISGDGNRILFSASSATSLDPDAPATGNVLYVRDVNSATTTMASRRAGALGAPLNDVGFSAMSRDGHHVAFSTGATIDPADTNGAISDIYVRDLDTGAEVLASRGDGPSGAATDNSSTNPSLSRDGSRVAFQTDASNLLGYVAGKSEITYVRDLTAGSTILVGRKDGATGTASNSGWPSISSDGNRVAFASHDADVTNDGQDARTHIYVRDIAAGTTVLASRADGPSGAPDHPPVGATTYLSEHMLSANGNRVQFESRDGSLAAGDTNGQPDTFVRDLTTGRTYLVGRPDHSDSTVAAAGSFTGGLNADGTCAAFSAAGTDLVANPVPGADFQQMYLRAIDGPCPPLDDVPPPGPGPTPDAAPVLSAFSLSHATFRVGTKKTAIAAAKRKKTPVGTTFRFTVSEAASMTFRIERRQSGRRKGKRCVAPTRALRKKGKCTRLLLAGTLTRAAKADSGSLVFSGRIGAKALRTGAYQVTAQATDSAKQHSKARTVRFTVRH